MRARRLAPTQSRSVKTKKPRLSAGPVFIALQSLAVLLAALSALALTVLLATLLLLAGLLLPATLLLTTLLAALLLLTRLLVGALILVFILRHFRLPSNVGWLGVSKIFFGTCRPTKTTPSE